MPFKKNKGTKKKNRFKIVKSTLINYLFLKFRNIMWEFFKILNQCRNSWNLKIIALNQNFDKTGSIFKKVGGNVVLYNQICNIFSIIGKS